MPHSMGYLRPALTQIKSNQIKSNEDAVRYFSQPEYLSVIFIEKVRPYVATVLGHRLHFP
jgi:hypothetical protein